MYMAKECGNIKKYEIMCLSLIASHVYIPKRYNGARDRTSARSARNNRNCIAQAKVGKPARGRCGNALCCFWHRRQQLRETWIQRWVPVPLPPGNQRDASPVEVRTQAAACGAQTPKSSTRAVRGSRGKCT